MSADLFVCILFYTFAPTLQRKQPKFNTTMAKIMYYVLRVCEWDMDTYIRFRDNNESLNPNNTTDYLFTTEEEARAFIEDSTNFTVDSDTYNEGDLFGAELEETEVLQAVGLDSMEALAEKMAEHCCNKNGLEELACMVVDADDYPEDVELPNYDIDESIDGAIVVVWSWEKYIGYAQKCHEVRYAYLEETKADLCKRDKTFVPQMDIVMTKEEVAACDDLQSALRDKLLDKSWKWQNRSFVESAIEELLNEE